MAKIIDIEAFKDLIEFTREESVKTIESSPSWISRTKKKAREVAEAAEAGLADIQARLSFDILVDKEVSIHPNRNKKNKEEVKLTLEPGPDTDKNIPVIINWLVKLVKGLVEKVNTHAELISFTRNVTDDKADRGEVEVLRAECEKLRIECDEVRQRHMKGNIIISSPELGNKPSLFLKKNIHDRQTNTTRTESQFEMIKRLIFLKTGVELPEEDIVTCHALSRRGGGAVSSYIVRVGNMRPGSAWEIISAGMLNGKNPSSKEYFSKDNVYISFQLTKKKSDLAKAVRVAKVARKIKQYSIDQNGRITIRIQDSSAWTEVTSQVHLNDLLG